MGRAGLLQIYHGLDGDKDTFILAKTFKIENYASSVTHLDILPSEESLILITANDQMYTFPLANLEILKEDENNPVILPQTRTPGEI